MHHRIAARNRAAWSDAALHVHPDLALAALQGPAFVADLRAGHYIGIREWAIAHDADPETLERLQGPLGKAVKALFVVRRGRAPSSELQEGPKRWGKRTATFPVYRYRRDEDLALIEDGALQYKRVEELGMILTGAGR